MTMAKIPLAGVIGSPVAHSRSPRLHQHWLKKFGLAGHYVPMDVSHQNLEEVIRALPKAGFVGVNTSARRCWLIAAWVTFSAAPALTTSPVSAKAANARSAASGGMSRQSICNPNLHFGFLIDSHFGASQSSMSVRNNAQRRR